MRKQITSEGDLFGSIMQQNVVENEFNCESATLATIQHGIIIEFAVKDSNDLYLDLNHSRLHVFAKITKSDGTNIDADTASLINLTLHSMFREIGLELNNRNVGDISQHYTYHSHLKSLLNFFKMVRKSRLLCKGWTKDTNGHISVTAVGGNNAGLNARAATIARNTVVELVGRPDLHAFQLECLIPTKIDLHMKFMQSQNNFECK